MTTTVRFRCPACGASAPVAVPARGHAESVAGWLDRAVRPAVARRHREDSPGCPTPPDLELPGDAADA